MKHIWKIQNFIPYGLLQVTNFGEKFLKINIDFEKSLHYLKP